MRTTTIFAARLAVFVAPLALAACGGASSPATTPSASPTASDATDPPRASTSASAASPAALATNASPATSVAPSASANPAAPAARAPEGATKAPGATAPFASFAPPRGYTWIDRKGDFALAAEGDTSERGECQVWNAVTQKLVAKVTSAGSVAGGATPGCFQLSPKATLVEYGNGRSRVWKNLRDEVTACVGVVAPDDSSCIEEDTSPFALAGHDGDRADLDLYFSRPTPNGARVKVASIPRGLNRDGGEARWWSVVYCSPLRAVIDVRGGARFVVDTKTGHATHTTHREGEAACP